MAGAWVGAALTAPGSLVGWPCCTAAAPLLILAAAEGRPQLCVVMCPECSPVWSPGREWLVFPCVSLLVCGFAWRALAGLCDEWCARLNAWKRKRRKPFQIVSQIIAALGVKRSSWTPIVAFPGLSLKHHAVANPI